MIIFEHGNSFFKQVETQHFSSEALNRGLNKLFSGHLDSCVCRLTGDAKGWWVMTLKKVGLPSGHSCPDFHIFHYHPELYFLVANDPIILKWLQ